MYRMSKMPVHTSDEQAVVDMVAAYNNRSIRVAEGLTPEQYFKEPRILELCHAISENQHDRVQELIQSINLNAQGDGGITFLYWAYFCKDLKSFERLLEAGADPDLTLTATHKFRVKPLRSLNPEDSIFFALLEHEQYDFFFAALPYTADVHQKGAVSQNLLHRAMVYTSIDRANLARLVELGFDLNARDARGKTVLDCTMPFGEGWERLQWLLELGADRFNDEMLNEIYDKSRRSSAGTASMVAKWIEEHCLERIEKIAVMENLLPSDFFEQSEVIELCQAISENNFQDVERLIDVVDINTQGANGITPLFWAYFAGNVRAFDLLLEAGANPDLKLTSMVKFQKEGSENCVRRTRSCSH